MFLTHTGWIGAGSEDLETDIRDMDVVTTGHGTFLISMTGASGGLASFRLSADGLAHLTDTLDFPSQLSNQLSHTLDVLQMDGVMQVAVGGSAALTGYRLHDDGCFGGMIKSVDLGGRPGAVAMVDLGQSQALYVADGTLGRITTYLPQSGQGAQGHTAAAEGVAMIEAIRIGGEDFVLASGAGLDEVLSYRVTASGSLSLVDNLGQGDGLGLSVPTALEVVDTAAGSFVIVAAAGSSSLSVMQIGAGGGLQVTDHLVDTLHTRFGGVQAIDVVQVDGRVFVVAGGADDGLSLFTLVPDGRLVHLQTLAHDTGTGLMNVSGIEATIMGDQLQVFVSSTVDGGVSQFGMSLADLGAVLGDRGAGDDVLTGGTGDDLLIAGAGRDMLKGEGGDDVLLAGDGDTRMWGGSGADLFVMRAGAYNVSIEDFRSGTDRLDLTDLPMLRSVAQLDARSMDWGMRLFYRDAQINIKSHDGKPLDLDDVFGWQGLAGPDRFVMPPRDILGPGVAIVNGTVGPDPVILIPDVPAPPRPPEPDPAPTPPPAPRPGVVLTGTGGIDRLQGGDRDDTLKGSGGDDALRGMDGNDMLEGGGGADLIVGGAGHDDMRGGGQGDNMKGGAGNDTMSGGSGFDALRGGADDDNLGGGGGDDLVRGQGGHDELFGAGGNDTLAGGGGHDFIGGGGKDDEITGGAGNDTLFGGAQNDTLWGEDGNDEMSGAAHDDLLWGGDGDDTLRGVSGDDTLNGNGGDDLLQGGVDDDFLDGGGGDDTLQGNSDNDTLDGGAGDDLLTGGDGADHFVFEKGDGDDRITDFNDRADLIVLPQMSGMGDLRFVDLDGDAQILLPGGGSVVLDGIDVADLGSSDFLFG